VRRSALGCMGTFSRDMHNVYCYVTFLLKCEYQHHSASPRASTSDLGISVVLALYVGTHVYRESVVLILGGSKIESHSTCSSLIESCTAAVYTTWLYMRSCFRILRTA